MKYYLRFLIVPLILGAVNFVLYVSALPEISTTQILLDTAFQKASMMPNALPELLKRYLPLLLFQIFYGTMIYRHFCTASVYYFSRKTKRVQWFLPECGMLFGYAVAYSAVLLFSGIGIIAAFGKLRWDPGFVPLLIYYLVTCSLFLFFTTLAINVLSILLTGNASFLIVEGACVLNIAVYSILYPISMEAAGYEAPPVERPGYEPPNFLKDWMWAIRPNLIANLNLSLHDKGIAIPTGIINTQGLEFGLNGSVFYFLILSIMVTLGGCLVIRKHSFIQANQETGGSL